MNDEDFFDHLIANYAINLNELEKIKSIWDNTHKDVQFFIKSWYVLPYSNTFSDDLIAIDSLYKKFLFDKNIEDIINE